MVDFYEMREAYLRALQMALDTRQDNEEIEEEILLLVEEPVL